MAPLINRNAIKAPYLNANAKQIQALYDNERSFLNAYVDVLNQVEIDEFESQCLPFAWRWKVDVAYTIRIPASRKVIIGLEYQNCSKS
jgi:hypothetical protein